MNRFRKSLVVLVAVAPLMLVQVSRVVATGPKVSESPNKHNLSTGWYDSTNKVFNEVRDSSIIYKAKVDPSNPQGRQICIFCHTPHNANVENQAPLWNRAFSTQTFSRYSSGTLQIRVNPAVSVNSAANYSTDWQPDGSSKLCLSCHDGVSQLGNVLRGGPITMDATKDPATGGNYISSNPLISRASFNPSTNKMKFGHHPVSFVYNGGVQQAISSGRVTAGLGGGFGFVIPGAGSAVKLDKKNKMQCTTCHDAHQNQSDDTKCYNSGESLVVDCSAGTSSGRKVTPFWVRGGGSDVVDDHDWVCTSCHRLTGAGGIFLQANPPKPFPYP